MGGPSTLVALLAGGAIRAAVAQRDTTALLTPGDSRREPFGISRPEFEKYMSHPDAVGTFSFVGFDISKPYDRNSSVPGVPMDGWSWQINATADVSLNSTVLNSTTVQDPTAKYVNQSTAAASVALQFPRALVDHDSNVNVDSSWALCIRYWDLIGLPDDFTYPHQMRSDDGSCSSVLSKECIDEIQHPTAQSHPSLFGCQCPDLEQIPSCKGSPISAFTGYCAGGTYAPEGLAEVLVNGSLEARSYADLTTFKQGSTQAGRDVYNNVATFALPIIVKFGWRYNITGDGFTGGLLSCPVPKNATSGNAAPVAPSEEKGPTATPSTASKTTSTPSPTSSSSANSRIHRSGISWWAIVGSSTCMSVLAGYL